MAPDTLPAEKSGFVESYIENLCIAISPEVHVLDLCKRFDGFSRYCEFWGANVDAQIREGRLYDVVHIDINALGEDEFEALLASIFRSLTPNGVLVFGGEMAAKANQWQHEGGRYLPGYSKLKEKLSGFAWKMLGLWHDTDENGQSRQWMFFHISAFKPSAFLLLGSPGVGKSTMARRYFSHLPVVQGDQVYKAIFDGKIDVSTTLKEEVLSSFDPCRILRMTISLFNKGYLDELVDIWLGLSKGRDVVIDSYVPPKYQERVRERFSQAGYVAINMHWDLTKTMCSKRAASENLAAFKRSKPLQRGLENHQSVKVRLKNLFKKVMSSLAHNARY